MENPRNELIGSAYTLRGTIVRNVKDVKLGEIQDIVLDITSGQIVYVILSVHTGLMDLDNRYFTIPWEAFHYDLSQEQEPAIILDMEKDELEKDFGFNNDSVLTSRKFNKIASKPYHTSSHSSLMNFLQLW